MRSRLSICTLLMLAASVGSGHAADRPTGSFGSGKAGGAYLTRDQLRACFAQQSSLAQQDAELQKEQTALAGTKADIARDGTALKEKLDTLDRTNAEAVAAYNDQAQARDKQIDDYQARVSAFNTRVDSAKVERGAYAKGCENRRYFEDDEIAIKKGK